jgi:hypothetical protein
MLPQLLSFSKHHYSNSIAAGETSSKYCGVCLHRQMEVFVAPFTFGTMILAFEWTFSRILWLKLFKLWLRFKCGQSSKIQSVIIKNAGGYSNPMSPPSPRLKSRVDISRMSCWPLISTWIPAPTFTEIRSK